jgi:hypothetical protein
MYSSERRAKKRLLNNCVDVVLDKGSRARVIVTAFIVEVGRNIEVWGHLWQPVPGWPFVPGSIK